MATNRRDQIIRAAQRVYAREGFHRATIKKIAAEARLKSPALIYWYFKDKSDLFHATVREFSPLFRRLPDLRLMIDSPPETVLHLIAGTYLKTFEDARTRRMFRILLAETSRLQSAPGDINSILAEVLRFIVAYLQRQAELGHLRPHDSHCAARSFMGSLLVYVLGREIMPALRADLPDPKVYAREVVGIFLAGLGAASSIPDSHL